MYKLMYRHTHFSSIVNGIISQRISSFWAKEQLLNLRIEKNLGRNPIHSNTHFINRHKAIVSWFLEWRIYGDLVQSVGREIRNKKWSIASLRMRIFKNPYCMGYVAYIYSRTSLMWTPEGRAKSVHNSGVATVVKQLVSTPANRIIQGKLNGRWEKWP